MAHLKFTMVCSPLVASKRGPLLMLLLPLYIWSKLQPIGAQDSEPYLIFSTAQRIYRLRITENDNEIPELLVREPLVGEILDVGFHSRFDRMFWNTRSAISEVKSSIKMAFLNGTDVTVLINDDIQYPVSLAVDWINDKLYWTDRDLRRIESYNLLTGERRIVMQMGTESLPLGLAVYPLSNFGWLYWVDKGKRTLERASVNGSDRVTVKEALQCAWPVDIDYTLHKTYWFDECLFQIETVNLNGSEYEQVISSRSHSHIILFSRGISKLDDVIFWTELRSVYSAAPDSANGRLTIREVHPGTSILYGIEVITHRRQPSVEMLSTQGECTPECEHGVCFPPGLCVCDNGWAGSACTISGVSTSALNSATVTSAVGSNSASSTPVLALTTTTRTQTIVAQSIHPTHTSSIGTQSSHTASSHHSHNPTPLLGSSTSAGMASSVRSVQPGVSRTGVTYPSSREVNVQQATSSMRQPGYVSRSTEISIIATPITPPTEGINERNKTIAIVLIAGTVGGAAVLVAGVAICYGIIYYRSYFLKRKLPPKLGERSLVAAEMEISGTSLNLSTRASLGSCSTMHSSECSTLSSSSSAAHSASPLVR